MRCSDIIKHIATYLPRYSALFSTQLAVQSVSIAGDDIDITFTAAHNLTTDDQISISNVLVNTEIDTLTFNADNTVTATTLTDHDLTENWQSTITLANSTVSAVNGMFTLLTVPNRRTFTYSYTLGSQTPPFGTVYLLENIESNPINGVHTITVLSTTEIRVTVTGNPYTNVDASNITVSTGINVSGATNIERLTDAYESQTPIEPWLFVVLDDVTIGKNRGSPLDAPQNQGAQNAWNIEQIADFTTYVFIPSSDKITGRDARDKAEILRAALYKTLINAKFDNGLASSSPVSNVVPISDGIVAYSEAYYVHQYKWQQVSQITSSDVGYFGATRAFRDLDMRILNRFGENLTNDHINLDDEPL